MSDETQETATVVEGDNYRARLVCRGPGNVVFLLEIDGQVCGEVPFDNLVKANTRIDPEHASVAEKQVQLLRREAAQAKAQVVDMQVLEIRVRDAEQGRQMAERERDTVIAKLGAARNVGFDRTDLVTDITCAKIRAQYETTRPTKFREEGQDIQPLDVHTYRIVGRVVTCRAFGRVVFAWLHDGTADLQLFLNAEHDKFTEFAGRLDVNNLVAAEGGVFWSPHGHLSLLVTSIQIVES